MKINSKGEFVIILNPVNKGSIIEKICKRFSEELGSLSKKVRIRDKCDHKSDNSIFMHYQNLVLCPSECSSRKFAFVYHVDDLKKLHTVQKLLSHGVTLLFVSTAQMKFIQTILPIKKRRNQLQFVGIGTDLAFNNEINPTRPVTIGIASNLYPDSRKNEKWILDALCLLDPRKVRIEFCGKRWEEYADYLRERHFTVQVKSIRARNYLSEYEVLLRVMKKWDVSIYAGFDEGSLGILDAYFSGCKVLVTKQGFHLDLQLTKDSYFVSKFGMKRKLLSIVESKHFELNEKNNFFSWNIMAKRILSLTSCDANTPNPHFMSVQRLDWTVSIVLVYIMVRNTLIRVVH